MSDKKSHSPAREYTLLVLERILSKGLIIDEALSDINTFCSDPRDRALAGEIIYGTCRWLRWIQYILDHYASNFSKSPPVIQYILELSVYQLLFLERVPHYAVISDAVSLARYRRFAGLTSAVNGILRQIQRKRDVLPVPNREKGLDQYLSIMYSHPEWLVKRWREIWDDKEVETFCCFNNTRAPLSLRVRGNAQQIMNDLKSNGIPCSRDERFEELITIDASYSVSQDFFASHEWVIQDGAASLVAPLLGVESGWTIWDICAAPGGKTFHMADLMTGKGKIISTDRSNNRLDLLRERREQLSLNCIDVFNLDLIHESPPSNFGPFDAILADVPCSGWGTFRRNPDLRWRLHPDDLYHLAENTLQLLENVQKYLKIGGVLVYSTCTLSPEENEQVIRTFLSMHDNFSIESVIPYLNSSFHDAVTSEGFLCIFPPRLELDGAFAARLRKTI